MSVRVNDKKNVREDEDPVDLPVPALDGAEAQVDTGDPATGDLAIDDGYVLEDGETWVTDNADLGIAYVEPITFDEIPEEPTPADDLLGPIPDLGEDELIDDPLAVNPLDLEPDDDEDDFVGEPFVATEMFQVPGTRLAVNVGDKIRLVKAESLKFVTKESLSAIKPGNKMTEGALSEADPDAILRKMAYGEDDEVADPTDPDQFLTSDGEDDGVVIDVASGSAYVEAQVNFHLPGTEGKGIVVFEKGDRLFITGPLHEEDTDDEDDEDDEDVDDEDDGKKEGKLPPWLKKAGKGKKGKKDKKESAATGKPQMESEGLVGRRTSRRLAYSARTAIDPKSWAAGPAAQTTVKK